MFYQLPEIERIQSHINSLATEKQQLNELVSMGKTYDTPVNNTVTETVDTVVTNAENYLKVISNIVEEAEGGYLVPQQFDIAQLTSYRANLPQWFEFVFKKEFASEKKNLDVVVKRFAKQHQLSQHKNELVRILENFNNLKKMYESINGQEKKKINIVAEAETLKNKSTNIFKKFATFMMLVTKRINIFVDENIAKAKNYKNGSQSNQETHLNYRAQVLEQPAFNRIPSQKYMKFGERDEIYGRAYPEMTKTYTDLGESPGMRFPSHPYKHQPQLYHRTQHNISPYHHQNMSTKSFGVENRYNYREHLPRWMNGTLTNYYF